MSSQATTQKPCIQPHAGRAKTGFVRWIYYPALSKGLIFTGELPAAYLCLQSILEAMGIRWCYDSSNIKAPQD